MQSKFKYSESTKIRGQAGQALLEYALLIGVAAVLSLSFSAFFTNTMGQGVQTFNAALEAELRAGGYPEAPNVFGDGN
jgi:hypothetical protein